MAKTDEGASDEARSPTRCRRCRIPWNEFQRPYPDDPTRCGPCYRCDSDPELQRELRAWAAENTAKRRAEAEEESRIYGVPLDVALSVRGLK